MILKIDKTLVTLKRNGEMRGGERRKEEPEERGEGRGDRRL